MIHEKYRNILILAPHPDDEVIGCGGLISLFKINKNFSLSVVYVTNGNKGIKNLEKVKTAHIRKNEINDLNNLINFNKIYHWNIDDKCLEYHEKEIRDNLQKILRREKYDCILIPNDKDYHPDHKNLNKFSKDITSTYFPNIDIFIYEVWEKIDVIQSDEKIDITDLISEKVKLMNIYISQMNQYDYALKIKENNWCELSNKFLEKYIKVVPS